jgi:hypothetical protein
MNYLCRPDMKIELIGELYTDEEEEGKSEKQLHP